MTTRKREPLRPPSPEDQWRDAAVAEIAKEMGQWLKATLNIDRPIRSMKLAEMKPLAEVAISGWALRRARREADELIEAPKSTVSMS